MKKQASNEVMGKLQVSKLDKLAEEEALLDSLRPTPYLLVLFYLAFIAIGTYLSLKTDMSVGDVVFLGFLLIPPIIIDGYRRVNRRIDALHHLVKMKYVEKN